MAVGPSALSMMTDFKCIINPYTVYVHNRHWQQGELTQQANTCIDKSLFVMTELLSLLKERTYRSDWEL